MLPAPSFPLNTSSSSKKILILLFGQLFLLAQKRKNLSIPLGCYSLPNLKRKLLTLLAILASLSITIAIKPLGFDLEELAFVPFARNDPQRNSPSPPQHEKWKAFRRPPQNNVLSKFQKWKWSKTTIWVISKSGNGAKRRFEWFPKVEMEQNNVLSKFQKWKWSKMTIWANSKSGNGAKRRFEWFPKVEMEQNDDLSKSQKWKWSKMTIWANPKSGLQLGNQNASKKPWFLYQKS